MNDGIALVRALLGRESELEKLLGPAWKALEKKLVSLLRQLERDPQSVKARGELDNLVAELMGGPASALVRRVLRATSSPAPQAKPDKAPTKPPTRGLKRGAGSKSSFPTPAVDEYTGFYPAEARSARTAESEQQGFVTVPVFFGTSRKASGSRKPSEFYGVERGQLACGVAQVSIPHDHRVGQMEKPRWWKLEFSEDPKRHVVLLSVEALPRKEFAATLTKSLAGADERDLLLFLHGYNTSFEDAARRTAQFAYDLEFKGRAALFSWPSQASVAKYTVDETNVEWSIPHFQEFLKLALSEVGARNVHVIAHSMGNRALVRALREFDTAALPAGSAKLREVVFAAPDIDADTFAELAAVFRGRAGRFTLYASENDGALAASKTIHKYARAGDAGPEILVLDGVDTIDASAVDTSLLGHSYYGDNRSILSDIHALVRGGNAPRFGMKAAGTTKRRFWVLKP
jgi:esterase/lipase superfamily enzyme